MIKSFADRRTALVFRRRFVKGLPPEMQKRAAARLRAIENAADIEELRQPPRNRLEALVADRAGQHSIRINDQWRVCFRWSEGDAYDVEIVDYH